MDYSQQRRGSTQKSTTATTTTTISSTSGRSRTRSLKFNPPPLDLAAAISVLHFQETNPSTVSLTSTNVTPDAASAPPGPAAVNMMTEGLLEVFSGCHGDFYYDRRLNPRRVLTKPSRPTYNNGHDNEKHDYILYVNDTLGNEEGKKYVILDLLGQGTFGQVVKCQNVKTREMVAVKVIKNQPAFFNQSMMEVTVLEMLNQKYDREDKRHIVRMRDTFVFRQHLCIVVELLSLNLYDLIKQNQYRGFSLTLCRMFLTQILDAMKVLKEARIIHCDLKPENILLRNLESPAIKVIDFGSACHEHQTLYTYIQSRFYRSPEVLLGLPYSSSIDMWSLGCIAAELFLGLPIFPGASNYDQIQRIVQTLGIPPTHMLEVGKETLTYFERVSQDPTSTTNATATASGRPVMVVAKYALKSRERYSLDTNRIEPPPKQYFSSTKLDEIIMNYPIRPRDISQKERDAEMVSRRCFLDFVRGLLCLNPIERWSPLQASLHPFITGKPWTGPFIPPTPQILLGSEVSLSSASSTAVAMATPASATATAAVSKARAAPSKPRPRSNTLSSLSLQDVPPQIQRITAATRDRNEPGVGPTERTTLPEAIPEDAILSGDTLQLPFEYYGGGSSVARSYSNAGVLAATQSAAPPNVSAGAATALSSSKVAPAHAMAHPNPPPPNHQPGSSGSGSVQSERISTYMSNRRVSQPLMAPNTSGRYAGGRGGSQVGLPPTFYAPSAAAAAGGQVIPSSVPNAVWYGPEPSAPQTYQGHHQGGPGGQEYHQGYQGSAAATIQSSPHYQQQQQQQQQQQPASSLSTQFCHPRRGSLRDAAAGGATGAMPNAKSPHSPSAGASATGRRASAPQVQLDPPSTTAKSRRPSISTVPLVQSQLSRSQAEDAPSPASSNGDLDLTPTFDMSIDSPLAPGPMELTPMDVVDEASSPSQSPSATIAPTGVAEEVRRKDAGVRKSS